MTIKYRKRIVYFYLIFMCVFMLLIHAKDYSGLSDFMDCTVLINNLKNGRGINIIPLQTIITYIQYIFELQIYHFMYIMLGNIAIFIPVGVFLSKSDFKIVIAFVVLKEVMQYVSNIGSFDIDTILLNVLGVLLGVTMQKIYFIYRENRVKQHKKGIEQV